MEVGDGRRGHRDHPLRAGADGLVVAARRPVPDGAPAASAAGPHALVVAPRGTRPPRLHRAWGRCATSRSSSGSSARCSPRRSPSPPTSSTPARRIRARCCRWCASGCWAPCVMTALADRRGRRRVLLGCAAAGCILAALSALAPDLVSLGGHADVRAGSGDRGRGAGRHRGGRGDAIGIAGLRLMAAWRRPARSGPVSVSSRSRSPTGRAAGGAGDGGVDPAAACSSGWSGGTSRRAVASAPARQRRDGRARDGASGCWLPRRSCGLFTAPASQLMNEFLREEAGSRPADHRFQDPHEHPGWDGARDRRAAWPTRAAGGRSAPSASRPAPCSPSRWSCSGLGDVGPVGGGGHRRRHGRAGVAVYGPELFPTSLRGRANGDGSRSSG